MLGVPQIKRSTSIKSWIEDPVVQCLQASFPSVPQGKKVPNTIFIPSQWNSRIRYWTGGNTTNLCRASSAGTTISLPSVPSFLTLFLPNSSVGWSEKKMSCWKDLREYNLWSSACVDPRAVQPSVLLKSIFYLRLSAQHPTVEPWNGACKCWFLVPVKYSGNLLTCEWYRPRILLR